MPARRATPRRGAPVTDQTNASLSHRLPPPSSLQAEVERIGGVYSKVSREIGSAEDEGGAEMVEPGRRGGHTMGGVDEDLDDILSVGDGEHGGGGAAAQRPPPPAGLETSSMDSLELVESPLDAAHKTAQR